MQHLATLGCQGNDGFVNIDCLSKVLLGQTLHLLPIQSWLLTENSGSVSGGPFAYGLRVESQHFSRRSNGSLTSAV